MSKSIYIAGPMSGYKDWNYPSFHAAAKKLRSEGWTVYSPAEKDEEAGYVDPEAKVDGDTALSIANGYFNPREAYMWDIDKVINGDGIYMLQGWEQSPGARGEHAAAVFMKKNIPDYKIMYEPCE
jgi:hypothetical protein